MIPSLILILLFGFLGILVKDRKVTAWLIIGMNSLSSFVFYNYGSASLGLTHFTIFSFVNIYIFITSGLFKSTFSTISILKKRVLNSVGSAVLVFLLIGAFFTVFHEKFPGTQKFGMVSEEDFSFLNEVIIGNFGVVIIFVFLIFQIMLSYLMTEEEEG